MKRLNNILSYLWGLLLLLMLTTCSDWEEIVVAMQGEEEVELTIQTNIPSLGGGTTRTAPTENITSITALAFDSDHQLIKAVTEDVIQTIETDSTGTLKVKVPLRTRRIHFIAKNNGVFDAITDDYYGQTDVELLVDRTSSVATDDDLLNNALHYWAMLDFENADDLNSLTDELASAPNKDGKLTLIRNMAKLILDTKSNEDYIAGFLNYNTNGTLVPYFENGEGVEFRYQTETNHDLPKSFLIRSDGEDRHLGKVHYLFEEFNDVGDLAYVICKISGKFYKFAFKPSTDAYYYIVRNCAYRIKVDGDINDDYGEDTYEDAVLYASPINDTALEQVHFEFNPNPLSLFLGESGMVTVTIPPGITELSVGYMKDYFNQGGVSAGNDITPELGEAEIETIIDGVATIKEIWADTYDVEGKNEIQFTITFKNELIQAGQAIKEFYIQFQGNGAGKMANEKLSVNALLRGDLTVNPTAAEMVNRVGSECTVTVTIPSYVQDVGSFRLHVGDANGVFAVAAPSGLDLHDDGYYYVAEGQQYTFTFTLNEAGTVGAEQVIDFNLFTDLHHLVGNASVTLVEPTAQATYELWFEDSDAKVNGSTDYDYFFNWGETEGITLSGDNSLVGTSFYDDGANEHRAQAMVMDADNSISFTIGATRYLTLLVANDDDDDTPSINLLKGGETWTTTAAADATTVEGTYNFGNGEITTAGRLIRYELPAGTYTLQGSDADYLLYYMRVSTAKPTMTDVVQPTIDNYDLSWSGGTYGTYLKETNDKYFVDEEATNFKAVFKHNELGTVNLSTTTLLVSTTTYDFEDNSNYPNSDTPSTNITSTIVNREYNTPGAITTLANGYNAGSYTLSGSVAVNANYKYANFYDILQLKPVQFEVKNTIKVDLYNSWDGNAQPVTEFVSGGTNIIGFKMPLYTMPVDVNTENNTVTPINFSIDSAWERYESGLGVIYSGAPNYQLASQRDGNQNNGDSEYLRTHPRVDWTYKISWQNIKENTPIEPITTTEDVYFSYNGTIAKSVAIDVNYTPGEVPPTSNVLWEGNMPMSWPAEGQSPVYLTINNVTLPAGTIITLHFNTSGGQIEVHDLNTQSFRPNVGDSRFPQNGDDYFNVSNGETSISFTLANAMNGFMVNGNNVTMTRITAEYPSSAN